MRLPASRASTASKQLARRQGRQTKLVTRQGEDRAGGAHAVGTEPPSGTVRAEPMHPEVGRHQSRPKVRLEAPPEREEATGPARAGSPMSQTRPGPQPDHKKERTQHVPNKAAIRAVGPARKASHGGAHGTCTSH